MTRIQKQWNIAYATSHVAADICENQAAGKPPGDAPQWLLDVAMELVQAAYMIHMLHPVDDEQKNQH